MATVRNFKFGTRRIRKMKQQKLGGSLQMDWEKVITISETIFEETKREALQLKAIMDKQLVKELEKGNKSFLRYAN